MNYQWIPDTSTLWQRIIADPAMVIITICVFCFMVFWCWVGYQIGTGKTERK